MSTSLFATTGPRPVVAGQDVTLAYGSRTVISHVTFTIMPGECWFVVGPNGAGKSTLLKAVLGLIHPSSGSLSLAADVDDRTRLGFVPQRLAITETVPVTVREFVELGSTALMLSRQQHRERIAAALARVHLSDLALRDLRTLSGGQRQRAMIARALVREPLLLVVDEPTTGLDPVAELDLITTVADLHRDGMTVLFVAHDLELVATHATHVALVAHGTVQCGRAADLLQPDRLAAAFGRMLPPHVMPNACGVAP